MILDRFASPRIYGTPLLQPKDGFRARFLILYILTLLTYSELEYAEVAYALVTERLWMVC